MEDIILLGTGGHAHSVADSIERAGKYRIIGFLDRAEMQGRFYRDYPVLGADADMGRYYEEGVRNAFVTVGFMGHGDVRERLFRQLKDMGYALPNIIDDTAVISDNAKLGEGVFVGKRAVINAEAEIGDMCIVNTGAIIEHDCDVGSFSHISVGSVLCGDVHVGRASFVGANAVVIQGTRIGSHCIVAAGAAVRKNTEDYCMVWDGKCRKIPGGGYKLALWKGCAA